MSSISEELGVTPRNITALVDALEEEGLVKRRSHPTDRRANIIELTTKGRKTTASMYEEHRIAVAELFEEGLSEDEQRELVRLLNSLREVLRRQEVSC